MTAQKRKTILHLISTIFSYYKITQIPIKFYEITAKLPTNLEINFSQFSEGITLHMPKHLYNL